MSDFDPDVDVLEPRVETWTRDHHAPRAISSRIVAVPFATQWLVTFSDTNLPLRDAASLEAAQRLADDLIGAFMLHDCRRSRCGEWRLRMLFPTLPSTVAR
jgi:hypothetical protein